MKCLNCPLCVSDYTDACGDGDIYCLVTGDYANDEGGCSRTNKWILSQDRDALSQKRREEESRAWPEMADYYEDNRDAQSYRDEIKCLNMQIQELIDELSQRDSIIDNLRDAIKVKELADKSYALTWIEIFRNRLTDKYNNLNFDMSIFIRPYWINKECNQIIREIKNEDDVSYTQN